MGIAITGRDVHGAAVGGRGMTISDLALIDALDPETRAVVERYRANGGSSAMLGEVHDLLRNANDSLREAERTLCRLEEGK